MAGTYTSTGTYSNLTRMELEALRRADSYAGGKALTIGDSGLPPEGVVGIGDVNAEPFFTGPTVLLDDVYAQTPPPQPGSSLHALTQPAVNTALGRLTSETVSWFGPIYVRTGRGTASGAPAANVLTWSDPTANFTASPVVHVGDLITIRGGVEGTLNVDAVGVVSAVAPGGDNTKLTCSLVTAPHNTGDHTKFNVDGFSYAYTVLRKGATQLFAVPGSGPTGREQTFLAVIPGSALHANLSPSVDQINTDRVLNLVPAQYGLDASVDRADAIYPAPAPHLGANLLGYRIVLYPDDGTGNPDYSKPISTTHPVIDNSGGIPPTDQRMTVDHKAGVIRFSCAPTTGGDIKPLAGCVNGTTGRLNLYAVYWAVDTSLTAGSTRSVYAVRSTPQRSRRAGQIQWDAVLDAWKIGATTSGNDFYVRAPDQSELNGGGGIEFGLQDPDYVGPATQSARYLRYTNAGGWKFLPKGPSTSFQDNLTSMEVALADKTALTMGDGSAPALSPGVDANPQQPFTGGALTGARDPLPDLRQLLRDAVASGQGVVHLRKGRYYTNDTINVPPGIILEGEGTATRVLARARSTSFPSESYTTLSPVFKFGPNTPWGVYDVTSDLAGNVAPLDFTLPASWVVLGYDLVWNPNRRVWGIVQAIEDSIYFNEVRADGTSVLPGLGLNIKNTATPLFKASSPNAANHSANHSPRIAYHEGQDEYAVVWVEENASGVGGSTVVFQGVKTLVVASSLGLSNAVGDLRDDSVNFTTLGVTPGSTVYVDDGIAKGSYRVTAVGAHALTVTPPLPTQTSSITYSVRGPALTLGTISAPAPYGTSGAEDYCDHPSVAVQNAVTDSTYKIAISFWNYTSTSNYVGSHIDAVLLHVSGGSVVVDTSAEYGTDYAVVSSTDVCEDELGGFLFAYSVRSHVLYHGTATGVSSSGDFTDVGFPAWATFGVEVGSRFMVLNDVDAPQNIGLDCRVAVITGGTLSLVGDSGSVPDDSTNMTWVVAPRSKIFTVRYYQGVLASPVAVTDNDPSTNYTLEAREPDFVRLSRGGNNWLLAYQSFNTTGFLSSRTIGNFDNSIDGSFVDAGAVIGGGVAAGVVGAGDSQHVTVTGLTGIPGDVAGKYLTLSGAPTDVRYNGTFRVTGYVSPTSVTVWNPPASALLGETGLVWSLRTPGITSKATTIYREHIATCALVLNDSGHVLGQPSRRINETGGLASAQQSRDIEISSRSLGGRPPIVVRPNQGSTRHTHDREVSALNFFHKWDPFAGTPVVPSLIPDVTWTGSDWVVVSPSKGDIHSDLGTYTIKSGQFYLSDPSFYFGNGTAATHDGMVRRATLSWSGSFNDVVVQQGHLIPILNIVDEHTIEIGTDLSAYGISSGHTNLEWALAGSPTGQGRIKNPGFRVSAEGELLIGTSYTTFADDTVPGPGFIGDMDTADSPLMYRKNSVGLNEGSLTDDFATDVSNHLRGNIYYQGVAVGRPKGFSEMYRGLYEQPGVAIAWGENFYGFLDRSYEGAAAPVSKVSFYRQSFGPYNNGLRSMQIVGASNQQGNAAAARLLTSHHVFTRHGGPATFTGGFATDGYRNCFAYPAMYSLDTGADEAKTAIQAAYTDAVGRRKIQLHGPEQLDNFSVIAGQTGTGATIPAFATPNKTFIVNGLTGMTPASIGHYLILSGALHAENVGYFPIVEYIDPTSVMVRNQYGIAPDPGAPGQINWIETLPQQNLNSVLLNDLGRTPPGDALDVMAKSPTTPSSPIVLWDGQRFVAAWSAAVATGNLPMPGLICFGAFPGDEDSFFQGTELTGDAYDKLQTLEFARISCGDRVGPVGGIGNAVSQLYACDMAFSGSTYAVLWVAGLNPTTPAVPGGEPMGGSAIGVAIFHGTGAGSAASVYMIDATDSLMVDADRPAYANPKIVWDGKSFVAMWRRLKGSGGASTANRTIEYSIIPEQGGLGQSLQVRRVAAERSSIDQSALGLGLGVIDAGAGEYIEVDKSHPVACQPGDIILVTKTRAAGVDDYKDAGAYMVADHDLFNGRIYLHGQALKNWGANVFGMILGGASIGDPLNLPGLPISGSSSVTAAIASTNPKPKTLGGAAWGEIKQFTTVLRLNDVVYNDVTDEYAVLYQAYNPLVGSDSSLIFSSWKKGSFQLRQQTIVAQIGSDTGVAAMGFNGHNFLVVFFNDTTTAGRNAGDLSYRILSATGQVEESGLIAPLSGSSRAPYGIAEGQVPGSGFGVLQATPHVQPQGRRITIRWNNRLNRWIVSAGYLMYDTVGPGVVPYDTTYTQAQHFITPRTDGVTAFATAATLSGRVLTLNAPHPASGYNFQPGLRLTNHTSAPYSTAMVVNYNAAAHTVTLDLDMSEMTTSFINDLTAGNFYILPREDVFCWTLGSDSPAIQLLDADGVSLENVDVSGGQTDIEERFEHMARPIWRSGGPAMGKPSGALPLRPSQYSHTFLTPADKVETLRLSNVRSMTHTKYGYGFNPGAPSFDRATFGDRNRKG
jgi:hypothetical protein